GVARIDGHRAIKISERLFITVKLQLTGAGEIPRREEPGIKRPSPIESRQGSLAMPSHRLDGSQVAPQLCGLRLRLEQLAVLDCRQVELAGPRGFLRFRQGVAAPRLGRDPTRSQEERHRERKHDSRPNNVSVIHPGPRKLSAARRLMDWKRAVHGCGAPGGPWWRRASSIALPSATTRACSACPSASAMAFSRRASSGRRNL